MIEKPKPKPKPKPPKIIFY